MFSDTAIEIDSLSKCYHIYEKPRDRLLQMIFRGKRQYFREFWALRDVSFDVKRGETVGVVGRNGSGKSTLLQMICGTLSPSSGNITVNGRIAALLELGSGFNMDFTGRENIHMSCALLGMSRHEADERFDDIAAFADIGSFLEQPVKTYSSGMFVRLAFSVNLMSKPDIMIVDEALSVGDMNFQAKCMTALSRVQDNGATVLFVSHDIGAVRSLCSRAIHLDGGKLLSIGKASDVSDQYVRIMREEMSAEQKVFARESTAVAKQPPDNPPMQHDPIKADITFTHSDEFEKRVSLFRYGTGESKISFVEMLDDNDQPIDHVAFNQDVKIRIYLETFAERPLSVAFHILDSRQINITGSSFANVGHGLLQPVCGGKYVVEYRLNLPLQEGAYSIRAQLTTPLVRGETADFVDVVPDAVVFNVERWEVSRTWSKVFLFPTLHLYRTDDGCETQELSSGRERCV